MMVKCRPVGEAHIKWRNIQEYIFLVTRSGLTFCHVVVADYEWTSLALGRCQWWRSPPEGGHWSQQPEVMEDFGWRQSHVQAPRCQSLACRKLWWGQWLGVKWAEGCALRVAGRCICASLSSVSSPAWRGITYLSVWGHALFRTLMDGSLEAFRLSLECIGWRIDCKIYESKLSCLSWKLKNLLLNSLTFYLPWIFIYLGFKENLRRVWKSRLLCILKQF